MPSRIDLRPLWFSLPFILAALLSACGGDDSTAPPADEPFTGIIHVLDDRFSPASVTVTTGDSVTWRWEGSHTHTVTQGTTPDASEDPSRLFDSPFQSSGTFGYRFVAAGTVPYFCRPHFNAGMKGTVIVNNP